MKKTVLILITLATLALVVGCKKEEPYEFGSSDNQATGTVSQPDQPESATAPISAPPAGATSTMPTDSAATTTATTTITTSTVTETTAPATATTATTPTTATSTAP